MAKELVVMVNISDNNCYTILNHCNTNIIVVTEYR